MYNSKTSICTYFSINLQYFSISIQSDRPICFFYYYFDYKFKCNCP